MFTFLRNFNYITQEQYILTNEDIEKISAAVIGFATSLQMPQRDIVTLRLSVEECLLNWKAALGEKAEVTLKYGNRLGRPRIILSACGENCNPFAETGTAETRYSSSILVHLGLSPEYVYQNGCNTLTFLLNKKEPHQLLMLGIAVAVSVIFGILGRLLLPPQILNSVLNGFLNPVCDKFFGVLRCVSGPMIFLSVAWGLYGIGDTATLSKIGRKMIGKYISLVAIISLLVSPAFWLIGPSLSSSGAAGSGELGGIFEMILNIFPDNIFSPFITGNTLQIIFLAMIIGIVLLFLGKKTAAVAVAIEQINYMVQFMVRLISKLVPYFIFIVLVQMIWSDAYMVISKIWLLAIIALPVFVLNASAFLVTVALKHKVGVGKLFKKSLPTLLISLSTASSSAAFGSIMDCCNKRLGVDGKISSFGVPLGFVMFKPTTAIYYLLLTFYFAGVYNLNCNIGWIITAVFLAALISMATPPIPGGSAAAYTMLFLQLGIPSDALSVALAVDILFDFFMTAGDMFVIPLCLTDFSAGIGKLDLNVLRE